MARRFNLKNDDSNRCKSIEVSPIDLQPFNRFLIKINSQIFTSDLIHPVIDIFALFIYFLKFLYLWIDLL